MKDSLKQALLLTACGTVGILLAACGDTKEEIQNEDSREDAQEALIRAGVIKSVLDPADEVGRQALFRAIEQGNEKIAKQLIIAGADPRKTSKYGEPYMHMAVSHHTDIELIRLLMDYGLNINEIHLSRTPLDHVYNKKWAAQLRTLGAKKYEELTK